MAFTVEPSDQLIIDWSNAGPDDALRLITHGTRTGFPRFSYFCMVREEQNGHRHLGLVPGAVPGPLRGFAYKAARELIGSCGKTTADAQLMEQWLNEQSMPGMSLLQVIVERLLDEAYVRGGETVHDELGIGKPFSVQFSDMGILPSKMSGRIRENKVWSSPGMVAAIEPTPRFAAVMHAAARY